MEYKDTAEYAYDLLEYEYVKFQFIIQREGEDNFCVIIPSKLQENLKCFNTKVTGVYEYTYPVKYRGMDIIYGFVEKPLFVLKDRSNNDSIRKNITI